jgi:mannose-6-phosphate isomerase
MKNSILYPFKFDPILKPVIWGGSEICLFKNIRPQQDAIGESWEVSSISGSVSIVSNGTLKGKSLNELTAMYGDQLLGKSVIERFGVVFPLLIKLIDAQQALSVQVHPNDELAGKRHQSPGKTEMWYVVHAAENAFLYSGFKEEINEGKYLQSLKDNTFIQYLQRHNVKSGDVFFLPSGRVHAIGAGCFIAEIQQSSDITYRIYDYNRIDAHGNLRELHTELAKDAIDYQVYNDYKSNYKRTENQVTELVSCSYFTTNRIEGKKGDHIRLIHSDTFVVYICLQGKLQLTDYRNQVVELQQGESVLLPAENSVTVHLRVDTDCELLETFISNN